MSLTLLSLFVLAAGQSVDGVKPIADSTPKYAQAFAKQANDDPKILEKADPFLTSFFLSKAKSMAPLTQTKYSAAQIGICGIILNLFDEELGTAIKTPADRISKGSKDFDSFTEAEQAALTKRIAASPLLIDIKPGTTKEEIWKYFAGTYVGMLQARTTLWHISPKEPILLKWIAEDLKGCAEHAAKPEASSMPEVASAMKGLARFNGKTLDQATMREIGQQLELTLKSATPAKYRW